MSRKFLDPDHPFFRPLWRRLLVVGLCLAWALLEFSGGSTGWALLFLAIGLYSGWVLLVAWAPKDSDGT